MSCRAGAVEAGALGAGDGSRYTLGPWGSSRSYLTAVTSLLPVPAEDD